MKTLFLHITFCTLFIFSEVDILDDIFGVEYFFHNLKSRYKMNLPLLTVFEKLTAVRGRLVIKLLVCEFDLLSKSYPGRCLFL